MTSPPVWNTIGIVVVARAGSQRGKRAERDNECYRAANDLGGHCRQQIKASVDPAIVDR